VRWPIYGGLVVLNLVRFQACRGAFIPEMDKRLVAFPQRRRPPHSTAKRPSHGGSPRSETQAAGVAHAVEFAGMSVNGFTQSSSAGLIFFPLEDFPQRNSRALSGRAIAAALNAKLASIQDAFVMVVTPPPVIGLGRSAAFKLQVEDRAGCGSGGALQRTVGRPRQGKQGPGPRWRVQHYQINVPQLNIDVDRVKVKREKREALRRVRDTAGVSRLALCQ